MGLLSPIFEKRATSVHSSAGVGDPALASFFGGQNTSSAQFVTSDSALRVSTVFACVKRISETLAMLPLNVNRNTNDGGHTLSTNHRLYKQLSMKPNKWQTSYDWRMMKQFHLLLRGNCYSYIASNPGRGMNELVPMHPDRVWPFVVTPSGAEYYMFWNSPPPPAGSKIKYHYFPQNAPAQVLTSDVVLHIKGPSINGVVGLNPIQLAQEGIGLAMATEEHGARLFSNGAQISKAFKHPGQLSQPAYDRLKASLSNEHAGVSNAHKTIVLEEGMDIATLSMTAEDSQFLESRKFQVEDIARIFSVPLILIGHSGDKNSTYASAEQLMQSFMTYTMGPWIVAWEQCMCDKLLYWQTSEKDYYIDFDVSAIMRGDSAARSAYYKARFELGSMSPDEIRAKEGDSPIADGSGKKYYLMTNLLPLDMIGKEIKPVSQKLME